MCCMVQDARGQRCLVGQSPSSCPQGLDGDGPLRRHLVLPLDVHAPKRLRPRPAHRESRLSGAELHARILRAALCRCCLHPGGLLKSGFFCAFVDLRRCGSCLGPGAVGENLSSRMCGSRRAPGEDGFRLGSRLALVRRMGHGEKRAPAVPLAAGDGSLAIPHVQHPQHFDAALGCRGASAESAHCRVAFAPLPPRDHRAGRLGGLHRVVQRLAAVRGCNVDQRHLRALRRPHGSARCI
mmetsp:Transcript_7336/g.26714  ORF Transcript_7336/g.26714 Transcript_7336/m.26714 type:complete len:239 (+) Transcript_7336:2812-3528(+)